MAKYNRRGVRTGRKNLFLASNSSEKKNPSLNAGIVDNHLRMKAKRGRKHSEGGGSRVVFSPKQSSRRSP